MVPVFIVDDMMRLGKGIPASFWKFTLAMLRSVFAPDKAGNWTYTWETTEQQIAARCNINSKAAGDWTRAYSVSGLFGIQKGKRHNKDLPGEPTRWTYNKAATSEDWAAFIIALSHICCEKEKMARHGKSADGYSASKAFALGLAWEVDQVRMTFHGTSAPGLPPVNARKIEKLVREGFAEIDQNGTLIFKYVRPRREGLEEPTYQGESEW